MSIHGVSVYRNIQQQRINGYAKRFNIITIQAIQMANGDKVYQPTPVQFNKKLLPVQ